jgi:hypothetical protein
MREKSEIPTPELERLEQSAAWCAARAELQSVMATLRWVSPLAWLLVFATAQVVLEGDPWNFPGPGFMLLGVVALIGYGAWYSMLLKARRRLRDGILQVEAALRAQASGPTPPNG